MRSPGACGSRFRSVLATAPRAISTLLMAPRIQCPVLLVHDRDDDVVPLSQAQEVLAALPDGGPAHHAGPGPQRHAAGPGHRRVDHRISGGAPVTAPGGARNLRAGTAPAPSPAGHRDRCCLGWRC